MASANLYQGGIWTWFNEPIAIYDSASKSTYIAWLDRRGGSCFQWAGQYHHDYQLWDIFQVSSSLSALDDHDGPAILPLVSGKILMAYSSHGSTNSFCRTSTNNGSIKVWNAEVTVNASGTSGSTDAYVHLAQTPDTNSTIWWFYRRQESGVFKGNYYRVSTDNGATWGTPVALFANSTQRPYMRMVSSGLRIDFAQTSGQPSEVSTNSLYHFYMIVDSTGSFYTLYKSDATSIGAYNLDGTSHTGSPPALPIGLSNVTQVYDGTTNKCWVWDIAWINGSLQILYPTFTTASSTDDTHTYNRATLSSGTWASDTICTAGSSVPNWIYPDSSTSERHYSPGFCFDRNVVDRVYLGRKYAVTGSVVSPTGNPVAGSAVVAGMSATGSLATGMAAGRTELVGGSKVLSIDSSVQVTLDRAAVGTATGATIEFQAADVRIEQWDKTAGTWAKTSDVANTTTTNARPFIVNNLSPSPILWWDGVYGSTTDFYTGAWISTPYTVYSTKSASPSWQTTVAPPGTQAYLLAYEGTGTTVADVTGGTNGTINGSVAWDATASFGNFLKTFSTSNFVAINGLASGFGTQLSANTPVWMSILFKNTNTTVGQYLFAFGSTTDNDPIAAFRINPVSANNTIDAFFRDNAASASTSIAVSDARVTDGNWHVATVLRTGNAAGGTTLYLDGRSLASSTAQVTNTFTFDRCTMGCLIRASASNGYNGQIGAVLVGWGSLPDPSSVFADVGAYQFGGTRATVFIPNPDQIVPFPSMPASIMAI